MLCLSVLCLSLDCFNHFFDQRQNSRGIYFASRGKIDYLLEESFQSVNRRWSWCFQMFQSKGLKARSRVWKMWLRLSLTQIQNFCLRFSDVTMFTQTCYKNSIKLADWQGNYGNDVIWEPWPKCPWCYGSCKVLC